VRIHTDASPVAKIDLDQSNPGDCHRSHSPVILGQKLRSFLDRFRGGDLHRRKTRSNLPNRSSLPTPGEHHARRNSIAACNLSHLCARRQRFLDDPHLVVMRPAPPPLDPAQYLDTHRLMTLKLDLRSHASQNIYVKQDGARRMHTPRRDPPKVMPVILTTDEERDV
jgi:hypothetical protein